jgi:hypothetical protein
MRTTVNIPDHLLIEAKRLAATRKLSLTTIFEESLRLYLAEQRQQEARSSPMSLPLGDMGAVVEGVDLNDTSELLEL